MKSGWARLRTILTWWPASRTSRIRQRTRSPGWNCSPGICSLRGAGDQLALALHELLEQAVALLLAELLDHHLLGRLRRNAAHAGERDLFLRAIGQVAPDSKRTTQAVHRAAELLEVEAVEVLARRADHRLLEIGDEDLAVDVAVACDAVEDSESFAVHVRVCLGWWDVGMSVTEKERGSRRAPSPA